MNDPSFVRRALGLVVFLLLCSIALGDRLTLKDGTVLDGKVIRKSDGYWIKLSDGTTRTFAIAEVDKYDKGTGGAGSPGATTQPDKPGSSSLTVIRRKAENAETPQSAVEIWQQFIDSAPSAADLAIANSELARWQGLADGHAEKIKGRWVSGKELDEFHAKMAKIHAEFEELLRANATVAAIKKLEEAEQTYPDSYEINFWLGYCSLLQRQPEKAITYFEKSIKLCPRFAAAYGDWALALIARNKPMEAIAKLQQAAEIGDSPALAQDLRNTLMLIPSTQRNSSHIKAALATDGLMAAKYPQAVAARGFIYFPYEDPKHASSVMHDGDAPEEKPAEWAGTGFLIDATGLILTNRHVAAGAKRLTVVMDNGDKKVAEVVNIDNEQDLALIRIKASGDLPFLSLSSHDQPAEGAECTVMGFPLYGKLGTGIKITRGIVTGIEPGSLGPDVLVDAKVNPGNSGGPMINKHGAVMAIVSMKTLSTASEDTYGIGLSAGHIRKFLAKNHVTLTPAQDTGDPLDAEAIAARVKPAAVCILGRR